MNLGLLGNMSERSLKGLLMKIPHESYSAEHNIDTKKGSFI